MNLPRQARKYYSTPFFHVIVQGINKEYIFCEERYINRYLNLLERNIASTQIYVLAHCIMNNHAHLLVRSENMLEMSKFMQKTNTMFANYYNKVVNRVGYVFRDRYISEPIMNEKYLINCINYIHNNPVKAGMVKECSEYKYSSYRKFLDESEILNISNKININLDKSLFIEPKIEDYFMDIDIDKDERITNYINKFVNENNIRIQEIFENRRVLKRLISLLKGVNSVKYTDIMKKLDISKGTMESLKRR